MLSSSQQMAAGRNVMLAAPGLNLAEEILRDQLADRQPEIVADLLAVRGPASATSAGRSAASSA